MKADEPSAPGDRHRQRRRGHASTGQKPDRESLIRANEDLRTRRAEVAEQRSAVHERAKLQAISFSPETLEQAKQREPQINEQIRGQAESADGGTRETARLRRGNNPQGQSDKEPRVSVAYGATRISYAASEVLRRRWQASIDIDGIYIDGTPLVARLHSLRPTEQWKLYSDDPSLMPSGGDNLELPDASFRRTPYPQNARDQPLPMVASRILGNLDGRSSLRSDLSTVLNVAYGSTGPVTWSDREGARLLARTKDGGFRRPTDGDVSRWRTAVEVGSSIRLYYVDRYGRDFISILIVDSYGDGRRIISPPAWFRERGGTSNLGSSMGYTLSGAAHPSRQIGAKAPSFPHVLASMEYWLARSYEGEDGVAPLLRPVRPGRVGPWAPSCRGEPFWPWYDVLIFLGLERFDLTDSKARDAALRRYWRIVEGLQRAGYMRTDDAGNGDLIEVEASPRTGRRSGRATPWLRFRASARFCEAARLATLGKWTTMNLLDWYDLPEKLR